MIIGTVHSKSVGKTTIAVHLAGWLDAYGYDVAIIDADWQKQCSEWLEDAAPHISRHATTEPEEIEAKAAQLKDTHDIVIVDGPAGLHLTPGAVLFVSDAVIVPCGPPPPEVHALMKVADSVREVQQIRSSDETTAKPYPIIVPVKTSARTITTRRLIEEASKLGFQSTRNTLPASQEYARLFGYPGEKSRFIWQVGRSKDVKSAVKNIDALFQEMFPEASAHDTTLFSRMMNKPIPRNVSKTTEIKEELDEQPAIAANE